MHGYPYEYEQEKRRLTEEAFKNKPSGTVVTMDQDYMMCCQAEYVHRTIDSLAGIGPSKRSPDDLVRPQIFEWLKERLSGCERIVEFVNKFLAHSATRESRNFRNPPDLDVTLGQVLEAHKIIYQTAIFIGGQMGILSGGKAIGDVLLVPQSDQFIYFDKAWASQDTINKLHEFWSDYGTQTRNWHTWIGEDEFNKFLHEQTFRK